MVSLVFHANFSCSVLSGSSNFMLIDTDFVHFSSGEVSEYIYLCFSLVCVCVSGLICLFVLLYVCVFMYVCVYVPLCMKFIWQIITFLASWYSCYCMAYTSQSGRRKIYNLSLYYVYFSLAFVEFLHYESEVNRLKKSHPTLTCSWATLTTNTFLCSCFLLFFFLINLLINKAILPRSLERRDSKQFFSLSFSLFKHNKLNTTTLLSAYYAKWMKKRNLFSISKLSFRKKKGPHSHRTQLNLS